MKFTKIALSLLALGLVASVPVIRAQDEAAPAVKQKGERKGQRGGNPDQMVARIDEAVGGLTADQKTKIKDVITSNMEKAKAAAPEDRRTIMQGQREQIRNVLTPEQQKKFDAMPAPGRRQKKSE